MTTGPEGFDALTPAPMPASRRDPIPPRAAGLEMPPLVDAIVPALPAILADPGIGGSFSLGAPPTQTLGDAFGDVRWNPPALPPIPPLLGLERTDRPWPMTDSAYVALATLGAMQHAGSWLELNDILEQASPLVDPSTLDLLRTAAEQKSEALGITPRRDIFQAPIEAVNAVPGAAISPISDAMQGAALMWHGLTTREYYPPEVEPFRRELLHVRDYDDAALDDLVRRAQTLGDMDRTDFFFDVGRVLSGEVEPEDLLAITDPRDSWLYREADALRDAFTIPATPGWEDSGWRQFGADVGGFLGGLTTVAALGPWAGAGVLALGGAGQAGNRYLGWTDEQGIRPDADQLFWSTAGGLAAGGASAIPLGRLVDTIPFLRGLETAPRPGLWGAAATIASRSGPQALIGAGQAGFTQFLQNVAQQGYDDDQSVWDGLAGTAWRGGLINGVAGAVPAVHDLMGLPLRGPSPATSAMTSAGAQGPLLMPAQALPWLWMSDTPPF